LKAFIGTLPAYFRFLQNKPGKLFTFDLQRFDSSEKPKNLRPVRKKKAVKRDRWQKAPNSVSVFVILTAFVAFEDSKSLHL